MLVYPYQALLRAPPEPSGGSHVLFEAFWLERGPLDPPAGGRDADGSGRRFVTTPIVRQHLTHLARAALIRRHPILLQGPTSAGKTSLVAYLAAQTGHTFLRINNHEHTDLQEYLGSYVSDSAGRLVFREGPLVTAVRRGWWVVLDELNLAPTEVLEALNRCAQLGPVGSVYAYLDVFAGGVLGCVSHYMSDGTGFRQELLPSPNGEIA